ncbi:MAG: hypothetical protein ACFFDF_14120 [Candidatus Odinarchaeota archaeon]
MLGESLRSRVFRYMRDHPFIDDLSKEEQNKNLIAAFGAIDKKAQALLKTYKSEYYNEIEFARFEEQQRQELMKQQPKEFEAKTRKARITTKIGKLQARLQSWDRKVKCPHCPGVYANEVMKFVGFRGNVDKNGICHLDIKGKEFQGEAWPPPVVPVRSENRANLMRLTGKNREELGSRFYLGILQYEVEYMTLIFILRLMGYENIALLIARGMGKTYIFAWDDQLGLKHFNRNVMMLSETNARKKVGNWIYVWALRNKYLKDPEKFARKSTYQHFELVNGARMDIYQYSNEELVGEHDYLLKMDDIVKRKWREKPTENQKMIDHFQSNINFIIRSGLELAGTRKFEGDVLEHIITTVEDMIVIKQSPFIECPHGNLNDDGTYDPCDICKDLCLLAPEIHGYDGLIKKMYEDFEKWYAEMMQNPKTMKGGMVEEEDIIYVKRAHWVELSHIVIGVDSTEADLDSTDMCGIVSCGMYKGTEVPEFVFLDADVRKMPFRNLYKKDKHTGEKKLISRGIIETIDLFCRNYEKEFPNVHILIAIERKGGGLFIIKEARNNKLWWFSKVIGEKKKDKKGVDLPTRYGIDHSKEKVARVFSELRYPIKEAQVKFYEGLFGSILVQQICTFPKGKYDDGADAAGMAKDEALKRWTPPTEIYKPRELFQMEKREQKAIEDFKLRSEPYLADQQKALRKRRGVVYGMRRRF